MTPNVCTQTTPFVDVDLEVDGLLLASALTWLKA